MCPRTDVSSGSTKPDKPPAELGTVRAELARDSSELLVNGGKDKTTEEEGERGRQGEEREEEVGVVRGVICAVKQQLGCERDKSEKNTKNREREKLLLKES